jgi:hypothetical protein
MSDLFPVYQGKRLALAAIQGMSGFKQLHPIMQDRVSRLMVASGGKVGFGEGFRSQDMQRQMFLSRYQEDPNGKVRWDNKTWTLVKGATAAPPGRSMHELGLAADLVGDMAWITANCGQFALKNFAFVNDEPWHVQAFELPNSRSAYEKLGSPWRIVSTVPVGSAAPATRLASAAADAPEATDPIPATVTPGMRGPLAGELQDVMIRRGLITDTVANRDEFYGPATQAVIRQFQQEHGLKVDARVGPKTWAALLQLD